ncbi:methyltransferase domain-containing protein [Kitasatospora phosalacinea]|uniref:Protein-L-isoaspartate O-methyltransferase n=1 Tax=Kitasatospora phosalacinea TaxID=2065 RepID=A0A9W6PP51_9ACTN|nr:methyltransferase domain-containing protein [Kitasatospora phosalacinea]GLW58596.1 protein-L-isoaspartate O-methyltransferase [Kitasatospora phosalacinea]
MTDGLRAEGVGRPGFGSGRSLLSTGSLSPDWAGTFGAVPRSLFAPPRVWAYDMATGRSVLVDRDEDPVAWWAATEADVPLVTQWDDGGHGGVEPGRVPTSSLSMPSVVASMLRDLDVRPGQRVLDVGTGCGWNAGLLAHRLGAGRVVSVECDREVAALAAAHLKRAGLEAELVVGDGGVGRPGGSPYDRVVVTYGVREVSRAWIAQSRPGGVVLVPWGTDFSPLDAVARLEVRPDGTAEGRFTGLVEFMKSRDQRLAFPEHAAYVPEFPDGADTRHRTVLAADALGGRWGVQRFVVGLAVPDVTHLVHRQEDGTTVVWCYGLSDRSWAAVAWRAGQQGATVYQAGPRRLWQLVERALAWWDGRGCPELTRFGLAVGPDGTVPWLDGPACPVPQYR